MFKRAILGLTLAPIPFLLPVHGRAQQQPLTTVTLKLSNADLAVIGGALSYSCPDLIAKLQQQIYDAQKAAVEAPKPTNGTTPANPSSGTPPGPPAPATPPGPSAGTTPPNLPSYSGQMD